MAGKKASDRNITTKTRGKIPWTTLALFERSAIAAPIEPNARLAPETRTMIQRTASAPSLRLAPKISPRARKKTAIRAPKVAVATRRPRTTA